MSWTVAMVTSTVVFLGVAIPIMDPSLPPENSLHDRKMSVEEARLVAMVENAKASTWKENLQNAVDAQDQMMLPGRRKKPAFVHKIEERALKLLNLQDAQIGQKIGVNRRETTKFWV